MTDIMKFQIDANNLLNWFLKDSVTALVGIVTIVDNRSSETAEIMEAIKKNRRVMEVIPFLLNIIFQVLLDGRRMDFDIVHNRDLNNEMRALRTWEKRKMPSEEGTFDSKSNSIFRKIL